MDTQLKKNIFARLFPAMAEPQTADDAAYSDPDREAPSTPTTRRFEMPQQAYSAPMTSENPEEMTPAPTETASDPGGSTLSRLGSYIGNDGIGSQMPKPDPRQQSLAKVNDVYKKKFGEMQSETLGGMMQDPATPSPEIDGDGPVNYGYGREMDPEPQSNLARLAAAANGDIGSDSTELPKTELERAEDALEKHRGTTPVDRNKGFKSRAYEAVQNALEGMALAYKANPNGHWAGILAGGAAGGVVGSTANKAWNEQRQHAAEGARLEGNYKSLNEVEENRLGREGKKAQIDEVKRKPEKEANALKAKFDIENQKFLNRQALREQDQGFKAGEYKFRTDGDGKRWKYFPKDPTKPEEAVVNPTTGEQEVDPGEQFYETRSPITGQVIKLKGRDLYSGESSVEASRVGAQNKTNENEVERNQKVSELKGKLAEADFIIKDAKATISRFAKPANMEEFNAKSDAEKKLFEAKSTKARYETELNSLPPAQTVVGRSGGAAKFSESEIRTRMNKLNPAVTEDQIKAKIEEAKQAGRLRQ